MNRLEPWFSGAGRLRPQGGHVQSYEEPDLRSSMRDFGSGGLQQGRCELVAMRDGPRLTRGAGGRRESLGENDLGAAPPAER